MDAFRPFLIAHIATGAIALLSGTYLMAAKKGGRAHRAVGRIFASNMLGAGLCSLVLATLHPNDFLFSVGLFSLYLTATGWRIRTHPGGGWVERALIAALLLGSIRLLGLGIGKAMAHDAFAWIDLGFAGGGLLFALQDLRRRGNFGKAGRTALHLQRMTGAYIAALTAFLVVNAQGRLSLLPWVLPTLVFTPVISAWSRRYRDREPIERAAEAGG
jgi:uncharacterized membrane protein